MIINLIIFSRIIIRPEIDIFKLEKNVILLKKKIIKLNLFLIVVILENN